MLNKQLQEFWIPAADPAPQRQHKIWFGLSIAITIIYSAIELRNGFQSEYVAQDDARQHVFWMLRFLDPQLFPNDLIADYYQSVAPLGFTLFYRIATLFGIDPIHFNKVVPMLVALVTTTYSYRVAMQLLPIPAAGFVGSLLLIQNLWLHDDLGSGTARAFVFPIFMAFLYYLLRRSIVPCLLTIVLEATFYPQYIFVMSGVLTLRLVRWERGPRLTGDRHHYWMTGLGLATAFVMLLPFALQNSRYGPVVTLEQAKSMLEFAKAGRNEFFVDGWWKYWIGGPRTGAFGWMMPLSMISVPLLPILLQFPNRFPLVQRVRQASVLLQVALVSVFLFLAAHALLFRLYLPSRYSQSCWHMISAMTGAIAGLVLLDAAFRGVQRIIPQLRQGMAIALTALAVVVLLGSPHLYHFPASSYVIGDSAPIYKYLAQQPKDTLVASVSIDADLIPTFAHRSTLASREYAIPYHLGYYNQMRQRSMDLIEANYTTNLNQVKRFIQKYGIDYWIIEPSFMKTTAPNDNEDQKKITRWINQYQPLGRQVERRLKRGDIPVLTTLQEQCSVATARKAYLLDATCILQARPQR